MRTLVRFTRTTYDDAEVTQSAFGDTTGASHFKQLETELREQGFELALELVKFEEDGNSALTHAGTLLLYVMVFNAPPSAELVPMLQHCYDQGASGFFEVIVEGLPDVYETCAGFDSEKGRTTWSIVAPGGGDTIAWLDDGLSPELQEAHANALCGVQG